MSTRRPLIAGNWKMNGLRSDARALADEIGTLRKNKSQGAFDLLICPPSASLRPSVMSLMELVSF